MNILQTINRIEFLVKKQDTTINKLLESCGLSKSFVYDMKARGVTPSVDKLARIAIVLDTTLSYLLGETDDPTADSKKPANSSIDELSESVAEIAKLLDAAPPELQRTILAMIRAAVPPQANKDTS